jgi:hypothetical protein
MRPFTVLIGILMGSAASVTFGLAAVLLVFGILIRKHPELARELPRLVQSLCVFMVLTAVSVGSFLGQVRSRAWRGWAHAATAACLLGVFLMYWPRGA